MPNNNPSNPLHDAENELLPLPSIEDFYKARRNMPNTNYIKGVNIFPIGTYPERDEKIRKVWKRK